MRKLLYFVLVVGLAASLAGLWLYRDWERFAAQPINPDSQLNLWVAPGTTWAGLVRQLETLGLARPTWHWRVYGRLSEPGLKAGEYLVQPGMTTGQLVELLESGRVREHRLTIVEGWTVARLREVLATDPRLRQRTAGLDNEELMALLDCAGCPAEGRFLPETYFFTRSSDDLLLLRRAFDAMNRVVDETWSARASDLPLKSPEELLVLASIIERETGYAGERAKVAGVFARRLQIGMRLQTDPTVIYGLDDDFDGRLRRVHLRTDHPWNTYTRHGLPPTPIALPGRRAIEAAANPAPGTALYFVARGDGSHQFSDTLEQHNAAVNRYIRGRR
ncbi:MAG: endolytic transglycosylase MltG [Wenzhouxiangella sp.]